MPGDRYDIHSVPLLEAKHSWNGGAGVVVLNDAQGALPRVKVDEIDGLRSRSDSEDVRDTFPGREGEIARQSFRRGKTVTYKGRFQAATPESLRYLQGLHSAAFDDETERTMQIIPDGAYGGNTYQYTARCTQFEPDESQGLSPMASPSPWQREFVLALRLADPRLYVPALATTASMTAIGGSDPSMVISNPGTDVDPLVRLWGPLNNAMVSRDTLAAYIVLIGAINAGDHVDVDFRTRTATYYPVGGGSVDWARWVSLPSTNWWDAGIVALPGGNSTWTLGQYGGTHPGIGAQLQVIYTPAVR